MFSKKIFLPIFIIIITLIILDYIFFIIKKNTPREINFNNSKLINLTDNGLVFTIKTNTQTIEELLQDNNLILNEFDQIFPEKSTVLLPNMKIFILRAKEIEILVDEKRIKTHTTQNTLFNFLTENNISLGKLDKIEPNIHTPPQENMKIIITRINIEEKTIPEEIKFKTIINPDSKMGWQEEKITQKGEVGVEEVKYRITYKNNKEISRIILNRNITKEPVPQIKTIGTYMKLGVAKNGQGTWYSYISGLFAASTTIPKGDYAKITNTANNKSIIVQINDYGPQGNGRIIDLDKIAFSKIAPIGAGVINVKVEQILN